MSEEHPYFCTECKRTHTKGKIYAEHLQFAKVSEVNNGDKVIEDTAPPEKETDDQKNERSIDYITYPNDGIEEVRRLPGVEEATLNKLIKAGLSNLRAIAFSPSMLIQKESRLNSKNTAKLIKASMERLNLGPKRASELWEERKNMTRLTTRSQDLDNLLGGGIEPGTLTELYGEFRTGKTQLCHQLCVNAQLPYDQGGLEGKAYYFDTSNSFRPERIVQMADELDLDRNEILENIHVARAFSTNHQISLIKEMLKIIPTLNIKLLVIDNIITHFLTEYNERDKNLRDTIREHLRDLQRLVDVFPNLIIVYTNQVGINLDVFYDKLKAFTLIALGGNAIAHASTTRVYLRKGKGEQRIAKLIHSPSLPEGEAGFSITDGGIQD